MTKDEFHSFIQKIINDDKPIARKSTLIAIDAPWMKGVLIARMYNILNLIFQ